MTEFQSSNLIFIIEQINFSQLRSKAEFEKISTQQYQGLQHYIEFYNNEVNVQSKSNKFTPGLFLIVSDPSIK
jgi:hypothetical protein